MAGGSALAAPGGSVVGGEAEHASVREHEFTARAAGTSAAAPAARLSALPLLTGPELDRELTAWNDVAGPVPDACVHQLIEEATLFIDAAHQCYTRLGAQLSGPTKLLPP